MALAALPCFRTEFAASFSTFEIRAVGGRSGWLRGGPEAERRSVSRCSARASQRSSRFGPKLARWRARRNRGRVIVVAGWIDALVRRWGEMSSKASPEREQDWAGLCRAGLMEAGSLELNSGFSERRPGWAILWCRSATRGSKVAGAAAQANGPAHLRAGDLALSSSSEGFFESRSLRL